MVLFCGDGLNKVGTEIRDVCGIAAQWCHLAHWGTRM